MNKLTPILIFMALVVLSGVSCGLKQRRDAESQTTGKSALNGLAISAEAQAGLIVYLSGEVIKTRQGDDSLASIGETILSGDIISTGNDGYCEIQFGETAIVRLSENTLYVVEKLETDKKKTRTTARLIQGTVLCKIQKLTDNESFKIRTSDSICGVRGTQFLLSAGEESTLLAVREGEVFILPEPFDLTERTSPGAKKAEEVLTEAAPSVKAGKQITLRGSDFKEYAETVDLLLTAYQDEALAPGSEEETQLRNFTRQQTASLLDNQQILPISPENESRIKPLENMEIRTLPTEKEEEPLVLIRIISEPEDADIIINGTLSGTGEANGFWGKGTTLTISAQKEGFTEKTVEYKADKDLEQTVKISLGKAPTESGAEEELLVPVNVKTVPANAELTVNGEKRAAPFSGKFTPDDTLLIQVSKPGYSPEKIQIAASSAENITITLKPEPVWKRVTLSSESLAGADTAGNGLLFYSDMAGKLFAVTRKGALLWSKQTDNTATENSLPVISEGKIYLSGDKGVSAYHDKDGTPAGSYSFSVDDNHLFGKRVVASRRDLWVPLNKKMVLLDPKDFSVVREIILPSETRITPLLWGDKIGVLDLSGNWITLDSTSGKTLSSLSTGARDSVAMAPYVHEGKAYFSGRKGNLVCLDLENNTVVWDVPLPSDAQIFSDITGEGSVIVLFTGKSLLAFDTATGKSLFTIPDATCPPLTRKGKLYFGTPDRKLIISNLRTGKTEKSLVIEEVITTRPVLDSGILFVGTRSGKVLLIIPEAIP